MNPLILSCNTGAGHNSAARAVQEQLKNHNIDCEIQDALAFASKNVSEFICNFYTKVAIRIPNVFGACYRASEAMSNPRIKSISYLANTGYSKALYRYLVEHDIDTVIMSHIFPTQCITHIRKKYGIPLKAYMISTDYDCCPFVEETLTEAVFIPHSSLIPEFIRRGVPEDRVFALGIPTMEKFSKKLDKREARAMLGLPQDVPIMLVMSGSMGFGNVCEMARLLRKSMSPDAVMVVLGGNNEKLKKTLREEFWGCDRVQVLDFTTQADVYMDACDVLLTKPGGLSSTEAAVKNVPLVHTAPIPGCESDNQLFFNHFGMSVSGKGVAGTVDAAISLLESPEARKAMSAAQRQNTNPNSAADIVKHILEQAK